MSFSKKTLNSMIAGAFAVSMAGAGSGIDTAKAEKMEGKEKCYGVVEAGKNMCKDKDGKHSCMGQASANGSGGEWIAVPKGLCDKLVGGSTEPYDGFGYKKAMNKYGDDGQANSGKSDK